MFWRSSYCWKACWVNREELPSTVMNPAYLYPVLTRWVGNHNITTDSGIGHYTPVKYRVTSESNFEAACIFGRISPTVCQDRRMFDHPRPHYGFKTIWAPTMAAWQRWYCRYEETNASLRIVNALSIPALHFLAIWYLVGPMFEQEAGHIWYCGYVSYRLRSVQGHSILYTRSWILLS